MASAPGVILVMGSTGSGKTTFINQFLDEFNQLETGDGLDSVTQDIAAVRAKVGGRDVEFIDTPGFDDTNRSEFEIATIIADWLAFRYRNGYKINGIVLMRDIRRVRATGSDIANRIVFEKLIGSNNFKNIRLMTSFWPPASDIAGTKQCEKREAMLREVFWKDMISHGANMSRFNIHED
ncbi:hypothetical protein EYR40_002350 [Pleurotus pulmonarius]|nr:hypothetical protein EYR36_002157 [Pleurotus pulmonarius]KAF4583855.1 hypothetical protein EYR40_002350 [Pleurotus pulmonarius]